MCKDRLAAKRTAFYIVSISWLCFLNIQSEFYVYTCRELAGAGVGAFIYAELGNPIAIDLRILAAVFGNSEQVGGLYINSAVFNTDLLKNTFRNCIPQHEIFRPEIRTVLDIVGIGDAIGAGRAFTFLY